MKVYICVLISKKNVKFLNIFLSSLNQLRVTNGYNLQFIFVLEPKLSNLKDLIKRSIKKKFVIISAHNNNIPNSRNIFLKFLKNRDYSYAGFLDDDCFVNNNWLSNMIKFIESKNCDIVGGPQKHEVKNNFFKDFYEILEPKRIHGQSVRWVATNNCFFSQEILKRTNIFFDEDFSNYGGSDQLFFSKFSKKNFLIKWNTTSFVTEKYQVERENKLWFFKRNFRYGYSGNKIDHKIYGNISNVVILFKICLLFIFALIFLLFPTRKNILKSLFYLFRTYGRIIGLFNYKPKKYI
jgi:hypothetical protein